MKKFIEEVEKAMEEHKATLETYTHYREALDPDENYPDETITSLIEDCDWEGDDFMLGYEQGVLSGMNSVLRHAKAYENKEVENGGAFLVAYAGQYVRIMANDKVTALYQAQCDYNRPPTKRLLDWKDSEHEEETWSVEKLVD